MGRRRHSRRQPSRLPGPENLTATASLRTEEAQCCLPSEVAPTRAPPVVDEDRITLSWREVAKEPGSWGVFIVLSCYRGESEVGIQESVTSVKESDTVAFTALRVAN